MDHLKFAFNSTYFELDYYDRAISYVNQKHPKDLILFYVLSDEPQWALDTFDGKYDNVVVYQPQEKILPDPYNIWFTHLSIGHDLALLSLANISILSYGTFGLWGSFLSNSSEIIVSSNMMRETKEGLELSRAHLSQVTEI